MTNIARLRADLLPTQVSGSALAQLAEGLRIATDCQRAYSNLCPRGTSLKGAREDVSRAHRALRKLAEGRGAQDAALRSLRAALESMKRFNPGVLPELDATADLQLQFPVDIDRSAFERCVGLVHSATSDERPALAGRLAEVTGDFLANIREPGRGGARKQARQYWDGLRELARRFTEAMPDHTVSADPGSVFYRYATHWLTHEMGACVSDPERHIQHALKIPL